MNTTQLTAALDSADEPWDLWRAATGRWHVRRGLSHDPSARTVDGDTIPEVLQAAIDSKRLPVIPRRPNLVHYEYAKGNGPRPYKVVRDGIEVQHMDRKKKAVEQVRYAMSYQERSIDEWMDKHSHFVDTHTEGVDFYYAAQ